MPVGVMKTRGVARCNTVILTVLRLCLQRGTNPLPHLVAYLAWQE